MKKLLNFKNLLLLPIIGIIFLVGLSLSAPKTYSAGTCTGWCQRGNLVSCAGLSVNGKCQSKHGCVENFGRCSGEYCNGYTCDRIGDPTSCANAGCTWQNASPTSPPCDPNVWGGWSSCSVACGGGTQTRTNNCGNSQSQSCNTQACAVTPTSILSFTPTPTSGTPTPTVTPGGPTLTPTSPPLHPQGICAKKPQGDGNCDGKIDELDFKLWLEEFDTMVSTLPANQNANFACVEGNTQTYFVDLVSFEIWRRNTTSGLITITTGGTPTPTITPGGPTLTPTTISSQSFGSGGGNKGGSTGGSNTGGGTGGTGGTSDREFLTRRDILEDAAKSAIDTHVKEPNNASSTAREKEALQACKGAGGCDAAKGWTDTTHP